MSQRLLTWILLTGTLCLLFVMRWHGKLLSSFNESPAGIVSLELAKTKERTDVIVQAWASQPLADVVHHAVQNTQIDFLFLLFYSLLLFVLSHRCALQQTGTKKTISQWLSVGALKAGLLDVVENLLLLQALSGKSSDFSSWYTWLFATVKFALVALVILWLFYCYIIQAIQKLRS
jgi:hypothetical protein